MNLYEIKDALLRQWRRRSISSVTPSEFGEDQAFMAGVEAGMKVGQTEDAMNYIITEFPLVVDHNRNIRLRTRIRRLPECVDIHRDYEISQHQLARYGKDAPAMLLRVRLGCISELTGHLNLERTEQNTEALSKFNREGPVDGERGHFLPEEEGGGWVDEP